MEPYLSPREFVNTFYKDISQFLSKNFHRIGTKNKHVFRQNVLNVFPQTKKSLKVFGDLARTTGVEEEVLMLLLESSIEAAHKIYIDNIKRLNKTNEKLQHTMRMNEKESRDVSPIKSNCTLFVQVLYNFVRNMYNICSEVYFMMTFYIYLLRELYRICLNLYSI
jgi:hypothetical protein